MHCPFCNDEETKVTDSRLMTNGQQIRRRRQCVACEERFTTYETAELHLPSIIKRDGRREPFREDNLRSGLLKALEKRPVSMTAIDELIEQIKHRLRGLGEREVASHVLGEWLMEGLKQIDEIAYVRFASVYRCFQDISEFQEEVNRLSQEQRS